MKSKHEDIKWVQEKRCCKRRCSKKCLLHNMRPKYLKKYAKEFTCSKIVGKSPLTFGQ